MKDCNQCGKCCINYGGSDLSASKSDIELWEIFKPEIYQYVRDGKIWFDPETGQALDRCPFLTELPQLGGLSTAKKYTCSIYHDRPEDCRHYPSLISEMVKDECEMIEPIDLKNPAKAQIKLDRLMSDSRSA